MQLQAQQNYFNVPNSEITKERQHFIQEQINFHQDSVSSFTYDYGVSKDFELGLNVFNTKLKDAGLGKNLYLMNTQYKAVKEHFYEVSIGTQQGKTTRNDWSSFNYLNFSFPFLDQYHFYSFSLGPYYATKTLASPNRDKMGAMFGIEYTVIEEKFHIVLDSITGNHEISQTVLGFVFNTLNNIWISLGIQSPTTNLGTPSALVLEFTFL